MINGRLATVFIWYFAMVLALGTTASADGGFFSADSVAVSADQRAILIQSGNLISMTLSTGYTGEGKDFAWVVPVPAVPKVADVVESGDTAEAAFAILDAVSSPLVGESGGCFPAGTVVSTMDGPLPIEYVEPGAQVWSVNPQSGQWVAATVSSRDSHVYEGELISIELGGMSIEATGNHPFLVADGSSLDSRPIPIDVPSGQPTETAIGRWVAARDLREGDRLLAKNLAAPMVSQLRRRQLRTTVYNLTVPEHDNYAVHHAAIVVHNKGGAEEATAVSDTGVTVHGTVFTASYEAAVVGASNSTELLEWLQSNDFSVDPAASAVLQAYIEEAWAFVAVKLRPTERRRYENEFLPPLTIRFAHHELVFPLRISAVSSTAAIALTVYVVSSSTVRSWDFPTVPLIYHQRISTDVDPAAHIEDSIRATVGLEGDNTTVLLWGGELDLADRDLATVLQLTGAQTPSLRAAPLFLTRLEARVGQARMTNDIHLVPESEPTYYDVRITKYAEASSALSFLDVALLSAAANGDADRVGRYISMGADLDTIADWGFSPLISASHYGHWDTVVLLLDYPVLVNQSVAGFVLLSAMRANQTEIVTRIFDQFEFDQSSSPASSALPLAASQGDIDVVRALLARNAPSVSLDRALWAAFEHGNEEIADVLLQHGADVDSTPERGLTSLMIAARQYNLEALQVLLHHGADLELTDRRGQTALMHAAGASRSRWDTRAVEMLLSAGADPSRTTPKGETALSIARAASATAVVELLEPYGSEQ